jgi:hypothetical protein
MAQRRRIPADVGRTRPGLGRGLGLPEFENVLREATSTELRILIVDRRLQSKLAGNPRLRVV